ncbi:MAG: fructosamine kinase family protein [Deltaproteobacteria bacterium]|nr:fructosamine kinase family protein [Deltaproteobacteria bacterium]
MNAALTDAVLATVGKHRQGGTPLVVAAHAQGGGCINRAVLLDLDDGTRIFVKSNADAPSQMFAAEAAGLRALGNADCLRVPEVIGHGRAAGADFIVLEAIAPGRPSGAFFANFGECFAELHRQTQADRAGFDHDNYIGSTPQQNAWTADWVRFFGEHRLRFQLRLAAEQGLADRSMLALGDRLIDRLAELLDDGERPCLLHGDLWSGNYLCDSDGAAVLIDPACYYGRREADLAMTRLFGGFPEAFYRAYQGVWPLVAGAETRCEIYQLYHLLNHLNLFGSSYRQSCMTILERYGR